MKIAFVITGLGVGGAERVVVDIADGLVEKSHTVKIFYLRGNPLIQPRSSSIELVGLGLASWFDLISAFHLLRGYLREYNPDVVHTHLFHANILVRLLRPFIGIRRLISTAHIKSENWWRMFAYRLTDRLTDFTTNVCEEAVQNFIKLRASTANRIFAVHNGISPVIYRYSSEVRDKVRGELRLKPDQLMILAVGRLHEQKDYPNLIKAISKIGAKSSDFKVFIAGVGYLFDDLQNLVITLGVRNRVEFLGLRRDIDDLMSAADVFVLSSEMEGFPMVIGEAMASECMIVSTDCGGVREFVGDAGILVEKRNPEALARALEIAFCMSSEMRDEYGRCARSRIIQQYSLEASVDKWVSLYINGNPKK